MSDAPRHLLVRLPNPLGDAVMATPALRGLRRALPATRITWVGRYAALAALDGLEDRDDVMPIAEPTGSRSPRATGRAWRRLAPDAILLLPHSISSALAARLGGARRRTGWGGQVRRALLTDTVALALEDGQLAKRPMTAMYLDLAAPYGAIDDGQGPRVVVTAYDRRRAARRLGGTDGSFLAVNPGAGFGPSKVYPPDRLAKAVRLACAQAKLVPLVLCGPGEEDLARETARSLRIPHLTTHERPPDVGELKALLERSTALLTTDTGPRHLARALGVTTVVIMGPTDPLWTEGDGAELVCNVSLDCLGCHLRVCPIDHPCMLELGPERVAETVLHALRTR